MSINNPGGFIKFTNNGIWGNPDRSSLEYGREMLSQVIEKILELVTDQRFR